MFQCTYHFISHAWLVTWWPWKAACLRPWFCWFFTFAFQGFPASTSWPQTCKICLGKKKGGGGLNNTMQSHHAVKGQIVTNSLCCSCGIYDFSCKIFYLLPRDIWLALTSLDESKSTPSFPNSSSISFGLTFLPVRGMRDFSTRRFSRDSITMICLFSRILLKHKYSPWRAETFIACMEIRTEQYLGLKN